MNDRVFVLHRNVPYEFGEVIGVFATAEAAISHVRELAGSENYEYSVTSWKPAERVPEMDEEEVWESYLGKVTDHRGKADR